MSLHLDEEATQDSNTYDLVIREFVKEFDTDESINRDEKSLSTRNALDEKSMTTQSVKLHLAMDAAPSVVKEMLQSSPWYEAFATTEKKQIEGTVDHNNVHNDEVSCSTSGRSDRFAEFTDYQLFQIQQYRIAELTSQLDQARNSVSEYHELLDRLQKMQQDNRVLTHKVSFLDEELKKESSTKEKQVIELEKNMELLNVHQDQKNILAGEVVDLKLALAEAKSTANFDTNKETMLLEGTVVRLKMELADSKSREDWHHLKRPFARGIPVKRVSAPEKRASAPQKRLSPRSSLRIIESNQVHNKNAFYID